MTIKTFNFEGKKYISVEIINGSIWLEDSFEYTDEDSIEKIVSLIDAYVKRLEEGK